MHKTALDLVISRYAQVAADTDPTADSTTPPPAPQEVPAGKPEVPVVKIDGYIATFLTRKSNPAIKYEFHPGQPPSFTAETIPQYTYGQGENFQWNSLVCLFTANGTKDAYVTDLDSDGRQGTNATIVGKSVFQNVLQFTDALKAQGVDFPFMSKGQKLDYKTLGMNNSYFVDVSGPNGERDQGKAGKFQGTPVLNMHSKSGDGLNRDAIGGMDMHTFEDDFDNKFYRLQGTEGLCHLDGSLDEVSDRAIKAILKKPEGNTPAASGANGPFKAVTPGGSKEPGLGKQASSQVTTEEEPHMDVNAKDNAKTPVDTNEVNNATKAVKGLNDTLKRTQEMIGTSRSASLLRSARSLMLKASEIY